MKAPTEDEIKKEAVQYAFDNIDNIPKEWCKKYNIPESELFAQFSHYRVHAFGYGATWVKDLMTKK